VQRGLGAQVVGSEKDYKSLTDAAQQAGLAQGLTPGNERWEEFMQNYIGTQIALLQSQDPSTQKRLFQYGGVAAQGWAADRVSNNYSRTTKTDRRGTTTTVKE
jgi:hypothetical protein